MLPKPVAGRGIRSFLRYFTQFMPHFIVHAMCYVVLTTTTHLLLFHPVMVSSHICARWIVYNIVCSTTVVIVVVHNWFASEIVSTAHVELAFAGIVAFTVLSGVFCWFSTSPTHRHTLYKRTNQREYRNFYWDRWIRARDGDTMAVHVFPGSRLNYIDDDKVMDLIEQNWSRWVKDPPPWFEEYQMPEIRQHYLNKMNRRLTTTDSQTVALVEAPCV